jgi:hypothetical protein
MSLRAYQDDMSNREVNQSPQSEKTTDLSKHRHTRHLHNSTAVIIEMLEGNESLAISTETGYRLCEAATPMKSSSPSPSYFSSRWCPNQRNRYYACLRNGYVHMVDTVSSTDSEEKLQIFEILFRPFSSSLDKDIDPGRHIPLHWDKMSLIPGRPGEVLFLLGITQSLFYSAFPRSGSPLASPLTVSAPGYTFGTPVTEIARHEGRITALEVSSCGQMVATGDEHGFVKVLMICRPVALSHTIDTETATLSHDLGEKINFECVDEELRAHGLRAHLGPIFSMNWINVSEEKRQSKAFERSLSSPESRTPWRYTDQETVSFLLVTGSNDRFIRL